jgi:drug/metabolite transporter (DMT)-like permease
MPFIYTQLASAAVAGWWVFGVWPDGWGWAGMAIIGACGAASAWLNVRAARTTASPLAADTTVE